MDVPRGARIYSGVQAGRRRLRIDPCIPRGWREFEITYRRGNTTYRIKVENPHALCRGVASVVLDSLEQSSDEIALVDDGQTHEVRVLMGEKIEVEKTELIGSERPSKQKKHVSD